MTSLSFFVPGVVSAQGSKKSVGNGRMVDMNKQLAPWRDSICYAARQAAQDSLNWRDVHGPIFTGPVRVYFDATYARPKSHYRTGKNSHLLRGDAPTWKTSAPDIDKVARAACDALTASGVWKDDAYVCSLEVVKSYVDKSTPGLAVTIQEELA